jgi:signal transduction histidine kinase
MPKSLNARLLLAFAFVIILTLAISAVGTLILLRNKQEAAAEERVGRLAEPITLDVALLEQAKVPQADIENAVRNYSDSFDVRILVLNDSGDVVLDTDERLTGSTVDKFQNPSLDVISRGNARFRKATFTADGQTFVLFAPPEESLKVPSDRLAEMQATIFELYAAGGLSQADLDNLLNGLRNQPDAPRTIPLPSLRPVVAVPSNELTSAWQDLIPQFALAGALALLASAAVAFLISNSVSGRLARVTRAAQEMAKGNYDQRLDLQGEDEVGRLAQAFNVMAKQVSGSDQMMRDLLANVSHELKTPLTSIQGFSQAIEDGAIASPEEQQQAARIINEESQRMRRLVDDLIELSRLESGQVVMQHEQIDLPELLRSCAERFEWQLRESGAVLQLDLPELPPLEGDSRRLEQAFSNLIDNAVRHTPKGGNITLSASANNGFVRVAVRNSGSYISPEELSRVFERFFQHDPARTRGINGGAGLGLAIATEVVQAHKGTIGATSNQTTGTEFVVTLPVKMDAR